MIEATEVLYRTVGRVGPKSYGNAWPEILREYEDLIDEDSWRNHQDATADDQPRPDRFAISRSEEALDWPAKFLLPHPLERDAIRLWAASKALGFAVEPILLKRKRKAERLIPGVLAAMNAERARARAKVEADAAAYVKARHAALSAKGIATAARLAIVEERRVEMIEAGCAQIQPLESIELMDVMPGVCLSPATYNRMRKDACARIADQLHIMEVPIR